MDLLLSLLLLLLEEISAKLCETHHLRTNQAVLERLSLQGDLTRDLQVKVELENEAEFHTLLPKKKVKVNLFGSVSFISF